MTRRRSKVRLLPGTRSKWPTTLEIVELGMETLVGHFEPAAAAIRPLNPPLVLVVQRRERQPPKLETEGSIPSRDAVARGTPESLTLLLGHLDLREHLCRRS